MFNYTSNCGITLTQSEELMLDKVDQFAYNELTGYQSLGQLHGQLTVELRPSCEERKSTVTYRREEVKRRLAEVEQLIESLPRTDEKSLSSLYSQRGYLKDILGEMDYHDTDQLEKVLSMIIFGEYIREEHPGDHPKVVLYVESIRNAKCQPHDWLLAEVYVHEMHHAWYDHNLSAPAAYIREVEEPLTELGMLLFMEKFDVQDPGILHDAIFSVQCKKNGMTSCYGFGSYIFSEAAYKQLDWRNALLAAKYSLTASPLLAAYQEPFLQGFYPTDEVHWADVLWQILHHQTAYAGGKEARPAAAANPDKLAVWGEMALTPDVSALAQLKSKNKVVLLLPVENGCINVQVYEEEFLNGGSRILMSSLLGGRSSRRSHLRYEISHFLDNYPVNFGGVYVASLGKIVGGKWALGLHSGSKDFIYDDMHLNQYGMVVAQRNGVLGVVDWNSFYRCAKPEDVCEICGDVLIAEDSTRRLNNQAIMDAHGKVVSGWYGSFWCPSDNGYMMVRFDDDKYYYGFVDSKDGRAVIAPQYKNVNRFENGRALVETHDGKKFYIDEQGNRLPDKVEE